MGYSKSSRAKLQDDRTASETYPLPPSQSAPRFDGADATSSTSYQVNAGTHRSSVNYYRPAPLLTVSDPEGGINLATRSPPAPNDALPNPTFGHSFRFGLPYDRPFHYSYPANLPAGHTEGAEISANETDFDYAYVNHGSSPLPLATEYNMHEPNFFNPFQQVPNRSSPDLSELYLGNGNMGSLHASMAIDSTLTERRDSEATVKLSSHPENSFDTMYTNFPIESDVWSSTSPSVGSFNWSPSTQGNPSAFVSPFLEAEEMQSRWGEPLLSAPQLFDPRSLLPGPSSVSSSELPRRERRGAISQQGLSISTNNSNHPMLDDAVAHQLYTNNSHTQEPHNRLTQAVSYLNDQVSNPALSEGGSSPSGTSTSTHESLVPTCTDVTTKSARTSPGASALARRRSSSSKSRGSTYHHPYRRTERMSEHEQVIQFDNAPIPGPSKRASKRSKGSKRCACEYVCPVKGKRCQATMSRQADMDRHMHTHRAEEEAMIKNGTLTPERATNFDGLKPSGGLVCENCGASLSRGDAVARHLKRADRAECLAHYVAKAKEKAEKEAAEKKDAEEDNDEN
ncbi:hypothetical protein FRC07_006372 [Ceratobasidium sp. 392]|nr:hypothetical protein FRC07_006372 [Ceratobasidium sp. 392]